MNEATKIANMLARMGAANQGKLEQYDRTQIMQQEIDQRGQAIELDRKKEEEAKRVKTAYVDASMANRMAKAGRWQDIVSMSTSRLSASQQFPGVDFSDTQKTLTLATAAANGDEGAQNALNQFLDDNVALGQAWGYLPKEADGKFSKGTQVVVKDEAGNTYFANTRFNQRSGVNEPMLTPVGDAPPSPVGKTQVVGSYGETASEAMDRSVATAGGKKEAEAEVDIKYGPQIAAAREEAVLGIRNSIGRSEEAVDNASVLAAYDTAMGSLAKSLGGTITGPVAGWLPALTDNQQIAKGAVATIAPVLKQIFRGAGEGTFTDSDQRILMEMVPTRKDSPGARVAKIQMIDSIVRAKLKQPSRTPEGQAERPPYNAKGWKLRYDTSGNAAYISPDGKQYEEPK